MFLALVPIAAMLMQQPAAAIEEAHHEDKRRQHADAEPVDHGVNRAEHKIAGLRYVARYWPERLLVDGFAVGRVYAQLGRGQREDQPAAAVVDVLPAQRVPQEHAYRVGVPAVDQSVYRVDHLTDPTPRSRLANAVDCRNARSGVIM